MVKSRKLITFALVLVLLMSMGLMLTACAGGNSNEGNSIDNSFTVKFQMQDENGDWVDYKKVVSKDGAITSPEAPKKADYAFSGWFTDKAFKTPFDTSKAKASTTVYAKFVKVNFSVKFMNGANVVDVVKSKGKTVVAPEVEAPRNHVFAGWFIDEALTKAFDKNNVTEDITVYAKFNEVADADKVYKVTFKVNGEDYKVVNSKGSAIITMPEDPAAKENWAFDGWYTDEALTKAFENGTIKADMELYAKFIQVNFTVKFMNGDTLIKEVLSNKNVVTAPTAPERDGYKFVNWTTDAEGKNVFAVDNVTKDVTVYAQYEKLPGNNVIFMIPNSKGWEQYQTVAADYFTNKVELPTNPVIKYMTFKGWFTDETFATKFTADTEVTKDNTKVYAQFVPTEVTVIYNGVNKGTKNLKEIENDFGIVAGEGKVIDGWYTDAAYKVKWNGITETQNLYARTAIGIIFNNGYEDIYVGKVQDNEVFKNPKEQKVEVDGVQKTLESLMIKSYMSDRDISYVNELGEPFDFTQPITKETKITVVWNSNLSDSYYKKNPKTGNYYIETYNFPSAPVISLLSNVTIMLPESDAADAPMVPTKIKVEAIYSYGSGLINSSIKKIMIGEGFVSIKGLTGESVCAVETVELPSSLKIIDGCFNNMPKLTNITIPDGVEVILASFFAKSNQDYKTNYLGKPYSFDIAVPSSVKNMAHVPNNFTFAKGSTFSKEGGYIYQNIEGKGKVLISDPAAYSKFDGEGRAVADTIVVPEGVEGIQVGTYNTFFNYLKLPSTFKFVNYNVKSADYPAYVGMEGSESAFSAIMLFDETKLDAPATMMSPQAYTITTCLGGARIGMNPDWTPIFGYAGKVIFATEAVPADLNEFAFAGDTTGRAALNGAYQSMTNKEIKDNVILKDAVNDVYVTTTFEGSTVTIKNTDAKLDAEAIKNTIIPKLSAEAQDAITKGFKSVKFYENGKEITLGEVNSDMFITMEIVIGRLTVSSSWQVGYAGSKYSKTSYENPADATGFIKGALKIEKFDITGMTAETLIAEFVELAMAAAQEDFAIGTVAKPAPEVLKANIKYFYDNAVSVKYIANGKVISDLSEVNIDNGEVQLEIVYEFK